MDIWVGGTSNQLFVRGSWTEQIFSKKPNSYSAKLHSLLKVHFANLLMKNLYPSDLIDKEIKTFLENKLTTKENTNIDHNNKSVSYYKLPYIGSYSNSTKKKLWVM